LDTALDLIEALTAPMSETEAQPFAYAYRYPAWPPEGATVIRFNDGREVNGSKPIEAIPLYLHAHEPLPVKAVKDEDAEWLRDVIATYVFADQRDRLKAIAARLEEKRQ
jgi:hypothetical protein